MACALPLQAEAWTDELLSRVFAVLANLEAPAEHRGADAGSSNAPGGSVSFLLADRSMFR